MHLLLICGPLQTRYLNSSNFITKAQQETAFEKTVADNQILEDESPDYRVLNLAASPFQDATTSYHHKSIGGYHGAKLKKYDELISFHLFKEIETFSNGLSTVNSDSAMNALTQHIQVLNMLNTKYIIWPGKEHPLAIKNPQTNGNAWFVKNLKTVANADSEIVAHLSIPIQKQKLLFNKKTKGPVI